MFSSSVMISKRRRDNWPIKLRKQHDVVLLHVPAPAWKKWSTNGGKTPESRESFQRLKPEILPKHWAGYYCLTTRAKHNIIKPIDVLATSWSFHFKKRCFVDPLHSWSKLKSRINSKKYFRIKFISWGSKSVQNLNLTSSQKVMRVMNVRIKFSLDVVVTIVVWANFMNEQTQNNRQRSRFLKIFIQNPKS